MRFLDFHLKSEKMPPKVGNRSPSEVKKSGKIGALRVIFLGLRSKSKNRIGNAHSIGLRARMIPHITKSVHWFGFRLWCYRFESLLILNMVSVCTQCTRLMVPWCRL